MPGKVVLSCGVVSFRPIQKCLWVEFFDFWLFFFLLGILSTSFSGGLRSRGCSSMGGRLPSFLRPGAPSATPKQHTKDLWGFPPNLFRTPGELLI